MTSSKYFLMIFAVSVVGCVPAKDPLAGDANATFTIYPDRLHATAELSAAGPDTLGKARAQTLHFDVCLQNRASGQDVAPGTKFKIADGHGGELERTVDGSGCIHWDEEHEIAPLAPERNLRVERQIKATGAHRGVVTLAFNVKPWLDGAGAVQSALNQQNFGATAINAGGLAFGAKYPVAAAASGSAEIDAGPRFDLADNELEFTYVSLGRPDEFSIDNFLHLTVPYRFTFSFIPRVVRQVFSGAVQSEPINSAKLQLTFVFLVGAGGEFKNDQRYLTSEQIDAKVGANGRVAGSILVRYPHMLFASGRQTLLMQIASPTRTDIAPHSFAGSLSVIDHKGGFTVLEDGRDADKMHREGRAARQASAQSRVTPLEEFLRSHDVIRTDVTDFPEEKVRGRVERVSMGIDKMMISREELTFALGHERLDVSAFGKPHANSLPVRLCQAYARMNPLHKFKHPITDFKADYVTSITQGELLTAARYCLRQGEASSRFKIGPTPRPRVLIQQVAFVEKLESATPRNVSIHTYGNHDFGVFYSNDTSDTKTTGFGIHLPDGIPMVELFANATHNNTFSRRGTFGQSQTMAIDIGTLEVSASVRNCVLITALRIPFTQKPWLICEPSARPTAWVRESFYFYSQIFGSHHSPFIDPFDAQSGVKMLIRGETRMQHMSESLQNTDYRQTGFNVFINGQAPDLNKFNTLGTLDELTNQAVPGAFELY